jgi:hypothetical protein
MGLMNLQLRFLLVGETSEALQQSGCRGRQFVSGKLRYQRGGSVLAQFKREGDDRSVVIESPEFVAVVQQADDIRREKACGAIRPTVNKLQPLPGWKAEYVGAAVTLSVGVRIRRLAGRPGRLWLFSGAV